MSWRTERELERAAGAAETLADPHDSSSLESVVRMELRAIAFALRKRRERARGKLAGMSAEEDRVARFFTRAYESIAANLAAANPVAPIDLGSLSVQVLRKLSEKDRLS